MLSPDGESFCGECGRATEMQELSWTSVDFLPSEDCICVVISEVGYMQPLICSFIKKDKVFLLMEKDRSLLLNPTHYIALPTGRRPASDHIKP